MEEWVDPAGMQVLRGTTEMIGIPGIVTIWTSPLTPPGEVD
jgi:hypothetical protein